MIICNEAVLVKLVLVKQLDTSNFKGICLNVKKACHNVTRYDWDDTSHMVCSMILYSLLDNTYRGSYDRAENGMLCCNRSNDQPVFPRSLDCMGKTGRSETQNLSHKLTLGRNREPLNRRSWRSIRASFIWVVLFFGDFEPISALDFHKVTRWQTKATSAHRNGQTNKETAVYSRRYSDVRTFKHRKQWILVLTVYKWGFCASRRLYEHSTLQSSSVKIKTGQKKADKDLVH